MSASPCLSGMLSELRSARAARLVRPASLGVTVPPPHPSHPRRGKGVGLRNHVTNVKATWLGPPRFGLVALSHLE